MEGLSYGFWLLVAVTIAYVGVGADLVISGKWSMAIVFVGYAAANVGMLFAMKGIG